ncbi:MAG: TonB-dependent receptor [Caulobacteraceae bacterium]|nr:TonB-dependent receptor [Caulobacteraceae bacterium]
MKNGLKAALLAGVAVNVLGAGLAWAEQPAVAPAGAVATASDAAPASDAGTEIGEIVVTAQHRAENIQNVPLTVQAFTDKTLDQLNVTNLEDLLKYTPNVTYANNGPGQGNIFMRGLSAGFAGNQSSATISSFPNVALYLDEQSMTFPSRNVDVYVVDMQRIEVLEGPQGTLFGGGAEAGVLRYITNKPDLENYEGKFEASYGFQTHGDPVAYGNAVINIPVVKDKFAIRAVVYDDHQGGYIDNVPSTFTRSNQDLGNYYFNIKPTNGVCPNGQPPGPAGCTTTNAVQVNNYNLARNAQNPVTTTGIRVEALYEINNDWNVLIAESLQNLDAEGLSVEYPIGSEFQTLQPLQVTAFEPSYDHDKWENTAWTVNGKIGDLKFIYTGGYMVRHISQQMEYSNYSRSGGGMYYECTGGSTGWGTAPPQCYSPAVYWQDTVKNTHFTQEARLTTPDNWRLRGLVGAYYEQFKIYDVMNFNYKTIPSCTPDNLTAALAGGPVCVANVRTDPLSTSNDPGVRGDSTAFGEDTQRGYNQTAVFGSADFDIIPHVLTISGGTRWYHYSEFEVGSVYATTTSCLNVPNGDCSGGMTNIDAHNDHVVYSGFKSSAGLQWHINSDVMAYFLFSQGFRPGGFNRLQKNVIPGVGGPQYREPNSYAPDSLTNYEIGVKSELFDHKLLLNISAYDMNWDNVQILLYNPTLGINTTFGLNGPDYNIKGIEGQFVAKPIEPLTLQGSASYNHSVQSNSPCLVGNIPGSPANGSCITETILKGSSGLSPFANPFGVLGAVPPFSPTFQGNIRARYDWTVGVYKAYAMVGGNYVGSMWNQPATYPSGQGVLIPYTTYLRYLQPGYATMDMSVGFVKDNWYVELYANNLTNTLASTFTSSAQFIKSEVPIRPRVVALKVGASF